MSPTIQASSNSFANSNVWDRQGLLALPRDTFESYEARATRFLEAGDASNQSAVSAALWRLYKIDPHWIQVTYSNQDLRLWEAGCTWYSDDPEEMATVQLKKAFLDNPNYLGLYDRDEVLAHEFVHVVRAPLGSTLFEEFFSYRVSLEFSRGFFHRMLVHLRAAVGPLFSSPKETILFLCLFAGSAFLGPLGPLGVTALFGMRLAFRSWQWHRCKRRLEEILGSDALALMVRLTDEEIIRFSRLNSSFIESWIKKEQEHNFRWRCLAQNLQRRG